MSNNLIMDGREMFEQLADKVARGELIITHFVATLAPEQYDIRIGMEGFTVQSPRTKLDLKITAVKNEFGQEPPPPARITIPQQVRELIFDEEPTPVYDEDLA